MLKLTSVVAVCALASLGLLPGTAGVVSAEEGAIDEYLSFGRPLEDWATRNGYDGMSKEEILATAEKEKERCFEDGSGSSNECNELTKAISLVARVKKYKDSTWQCEVYLNGDKLVTDSEKGHWLVGGQNNIHFFNVSFEGSGYVDGGWGKFVIQFYNKGSKAAFEKLEFVRTPENSWGNLKHHAEFGELISLRLDRALTKGTKAVTTSFDTSGRLIKVVNTSLLGYSRIKKLCGL